MASVEIISGTDFEVGESVTLAVRAFDNAGAPTAAVPTVRIYSPTRNTAGEDAWWKTADSTWSAAAVNNVMVVVDAANLVGLYVVSFPHSTAFPTPAEQAIHLYFLPNGGAAADSKVTTLRFRHSLSTLPVADSQFDGVAAVDTLGELWSILRIVNTHDQIIDDGEKEHKYFASTGAAVGTVALRFGLQDASGLKSAREVFRKVRT